MKYTKNRWRAERPPTKAVDVVDQLHAPINYCHPTSPQHVAVSHSDMNPRGQRNLPLGTSPSKGELNLPFPTAEIPTGLRRRLPTAGRRTSSYSTRGSHSISISAGINSQPTNNASGSPSTNSRGSNNSIKPR